jgi:hypothetical protein
MMVPEKISKTTFWAKTTYKTSQKNLMLGRLYWVTGSGKRSTSSVPKNPESLLRLESIKKSMH